MNLGAMLTSIYSILNYPPVPAAAVTDRIRTSINETLQELISEPGIGSWVTSHTPPMTVASVANQAVYAAPYAMSRIDAITERADNRKLEMKDWAWYRAANPDPTIYSSTPQAWVPLGEQAVQVQPTAATGLWAVSSASADSTQKVFCETVLSNGGIAAPSASLSGTARVQVGSDTTHLQVTKCYLDKGTVGAVSLYDAVAAGNLLATIPAGQTYGRWFAFALWPTPAAVITYYLDGERDLATMTQMSDEPPIPARFHRVVKDGALWREYDKGDDDRVTLARKRYDRGVSQLRYFVSCPPDFLPSRQPAPGISRFGGYYPVTRY